MFISEGELYFFKYLWVFLAMMMLTVVIMATCNDTWRWLVARNIIGIVQWRNFLWRAWLCHLSLWSLDVLLGSMFQARHHRRSSSIVWWLAELEMNEGYFIYLWVEVGRRLRRVPRATELLLIWCLYNPRLVISQRDPSSESQVNRFLWID